jgi:hypothetical protein
MKHSDFKIGMIFYLCTGQAWRCTDTGSRTINAIELPDHLSKDWFNGPPYAVQEIVFDEHDMAGAYCDVKGLIDERVASAKNSAHPGFPQEVMEIIVKSWSNRDEYPRRKLLTIDRINVEGEILHPYSAVREGEQWQILVYLPFEKEFREIVEAEFIVLEPATEEAYVKRSLK